MELTKGVRVMLRYLVVGSALVFMLWSPKNTAADKLDDFKEAASKAGCQAIPYSSERSECEDQQRRKDSECKDFGCARSEVEKLLEKLKEKRQNLSDAKSRKNESAIQDLENTVKELEKDLKERKNIAEKRINRCKDCISARERVQRVFSDVKSRVQNESDIALKSYVDKLVEHYEKGAAEHVKPLEEVRAALSNCEWVVREVNW
jgi:chromosome segregation ATPase